MTDPSSDVERLARTYQAYLDCGGTDHPDRYLRRHPDATPGAKEALAVVHALRADARELAELEVGPYRIEEELGRGAQGMVFRAVDTRLGRVVALKLFTPSTEDPAGFYLRFKREAESASRIQHPNVCTVYEAGVDRGKPYIAMQLVVGTPLLAWRPDVSGERAAHTQRIQLVERIADGLAAAHQAGLVHRDIKPGNIIVANDGVPVLVDFGLARADVPDRETLTRTGDLHGTPAYMAPEQILDARRVDHRTDVYALGVVAYELLAGHRPFDGATINELLSNIVRSDPERPKGVGRDLWTVIRTALEKEPGHRYASASDFAEDLRRVRRHETIRARPPGPIRRTRQWVRRRPAVALALILTVGGALVFAAQSNAATRRLAREKQQVEVARAQADRRAYLANIQAADASLANYDASEAEQRLAACPEAMRGWEWRYLATSLDESVQRVPAHDGGVRAMALSSDGTALASVGADGHLRVWATDDLRQLAAWKAGSAIDLYCVAISPDGASIATGARDGTVTIWSRTGERLATIQHHRDFIFSLAFAPDGSALWSGDTKGVLAAHDVSGRQILFEHPFVVGTIRDIAFSADGQTVVYGTSAGRIVRVNLEDGTQRTLLNHRLTTWDLRFVAQDRLILLAFSDGTMRLIESDSGREVDVHTGHRRRLTAVAATRDGRYLSVSLDGSIRVWNPRTPAEELVLVGHRGSVQALQWHERARQAFTGGDDGSIRRWRLTPTWAHTFSSESEPQPYSVSFPPDDRAVAVAGATGRVFVHDTWSGDIRARLMGHILPIRALAHSVDGRWMVSASRDASVRVWDAASNKLIRVLRAPSEQLAVAIHPTGDQIAAAGTEGCIRTWHPQTGQPVAIFGAHPDPILDLAYGPDGTVIAAARVDGTSIFELATGKRVQHLPGPARRISFSPDGGRIAVMREDRVLIHDVLSGAVLYELAGHLQSLVDVQWHPSETRIATAARDQTVRLWNSETGATVCVLRQTRSWIRAIAWSQDGVSLAAVSSDRTIRVWRSRRPDGFAEAMLERERGRREAQSTIQAAWDAGLCSPEAVAFVARREGLSTAARHAATHATLEASWRYKDRPRDGLPWQLLAKSSFSKSERTELEQAAHRVEIAEGGRLRAMPSLALADLRLGRPARAIKRLRGYELEQERLSYAPLAFYSRVVHALALLDLGSRVQASERMDGIEERWRELKRPSRVERVLYEELSERLQSSDK